MCYFIINDCQFFFRRRFQDVLNYKLGSYSISLWINDGLMTIFFLLVGLEIKREILEGEFLVSKMLHSYICSIGGMLVPALFLFFQSRF
jgi:NhaA family Na+:H+ antiporter